MSSKVKNVRPVVILRTGLIKNHKHLKVINNKQFFKSDLIYESKDGDFLRAAGRKVAVINTLNRITNASRTIATFTGSDGVKAANSDGLVKLIGQSNYETVLSALCSVISQELRVRGILALLTTPKKSKDASTQTEKPDLNETSSQTKETFFNIFSKPKPKRARRPIEPYVVKEPQIKKLVIHPEDFYKKNIELSNDNSSDVTGSWSSFATRSTLLKDPLALLNDVDKYIKTPGNDSLSKCNSLENFLDVSDLYDFKTMKSERPIIMNDEHKRKIASSLSYVEWTTCLVRDEDGNLPIHNAVLNDNIKMLKRQCQVLKKKNHSVDIPGNGNWTALKLAILKDQPKCTEVLLSFDADVLLADESDRLPLHHAAEVSSQHLELILEHCKQNARKIYLEEESLWKENIAEYSDDIILDYLLSYMCNACDSEGNTALSIACKRGRHENARLLLRAEPGSANRSAPTGGDTALHSAVAAAVAVFRESGDRIAIENYKKTIEVLVDGDASPSVPNCAGLTVTDMLADADAPDLSALLAAALSSRRLGAARCPPGPYMLLRGQDGRLDVAHVASRQPARAPAARDRGLPTEPKTKIIENVLVNLGSSIGNVKVRNVCRGSDARNIRITAKRSGSARGEAAGKKTKL